jgi:hypothetical protein
MLAACHTLSFDTARGILIHSPAVMGLFKSRVSPSAQWLIVEDDPDDPAGRSEPPRPNCCIRAGTIHSALKYSIIAPYLFTELDIIYSASLTQ